MIDYSSDKYKGIHEDNLRLLKRYEMLSINRGLTEESIKAQCGSDIPLFLRFIGKDKKLEEVTNRDIDDFFFICQTERNNSPCALNRKYTSLNSFFKHLIRRDFLDMKNPMDKVDKIKERGKMRDPLTKEQIQQLMDYLEEKQDIRGAALLALYYSSGCRLSEINQLNRKDIDFENKQFRVIGKGRKPRLCIFSSDAKEKLLRYLNDRSDELEALFISRENNRLSKRAIESWFNKIGKECLGERVFPHRIRHSAGDHARRRGVKIEDIQLFLGHSDPGVTASIYARGDLAEIQDLFDE